MPDDDMAMTIIEGFFGKITLLEAMILRFSPETSRWILLDGMNGERNDLIMRERRRIIRNLKLTNCWARRTCSRGSSRPRAIAIGRLQRSSTRRSWMIKIARSLLKRGQTSSANCKGGYIAHEIARKEG
jgi:hypothetical protein